MVHPGHHPSLAIGITNCEGVVQAQAAPVEAGKVMFRKMARYCKEAKVDRRRN